MYIDHTQITGTLSAPDSLRLLAEPTNPVWEWIRNVFLACSELYSTECDDAEGCNL